MTSVGTDLEKKFVEIREAHEANRKYFASHSKSRLVLSILCLFFESP